MKLVTLSLALLALAGPVAAQQELPAYRTHRLSVSSGAHTARGARPELVFEHAVTVAGAPWMRLVFEGAELGRDSHLALFAPRDGGYQLIDGAALDQARRASALFNGDTVVVQLFAAPGDADVSFDLGWVQVGEPGQPGGYQVLCGPDSRVASSDNRVGRLFFGGCTAWRVTNGAFVTAGHCVDFDFPDGVLDLFGMVEFNVPPSTTGGATVFASPSDQYMIDLTTVQWRFDGEGQGLGKDWAVFGVFANSTTGLLPHQAYGLPLRVSDAVLAVGATVRLTGFGLDRTPPGALGGHNAQTFTNQTSTGPYRGHFAGNVAADLYHEYEVDSESGNSGGPILWEAFGLAIGVHTTGSCVPGTFGNLGTSLNVSAFRNTLHGFPGGAVECVDFGHPFRGIETGVVTNPWSSVEEGLVASAPGGRVSIVAGTYTETFTATNAALLEAPVGTVVIR